MKSKLTKKEFVAWLREIEPEMEFFRRDPEHCPIAGYLCSRETDQILVGTNTIDIGDAMIRTPLWAHEFIEKIDSVNGNVVKADEALVAIGAKRSAVSAPGEQA